MVLTDFLTETRRRWLKAFKLFKRSKSRKSGRNRVSPALLRAPSYCGTVDASADIHLHRFCACRGSLPPTPVDAQDNHSYYSSYNSFNSSRVDSLESYGTNESTRSDSAYDSARSSPARARVCYATVTYFNVTDSEDSSSVLTEYTLLDECEERDPPEDALERTQNHINEGIELVSTL